ncbi:MAG: urease accessory UreF family protein [Terrimicrobiaceae bacterium]
MSPADMRAEIFRVAKLCAPCLDSMGPATFHGNPANSSELTNWLSSVWTPCVSPALQAAHAAAKIGSRELIEADLRVDLQLAGPLAKTSRAAGRQLATQFLAPASEPALLKFIAAVKTNSSPGHLAVVFAARAAIFHIPLPTTHAALLFLEMRAAPIDSLWPILEDCLATEKNSWPSLHAA